ncbi:MAG: 3-oxoacyl-[acyl-carrier protein] reductase [Acidimicrobiales bacterium]|jgi:3-oxoacyl-[acyl-carrier protein] reductase
MDLGITGRKALVTGSYRGTGSAIAASLAAEGVHVLVHGFELGQADEVVASIVAAGGSATAVVGDLLTDEGAAELLAACGDDLDIVVCNYGVAEGGRWATATSDDWFDAYNKNVVSIVRIASAVAPQLAARSWGRIVLLGTVGSVRPAKQRPQYYGAKGALPAITVSLAKEMANTGVTVNLVSPGIIATAEVLERLGDRPFEDVFGMSTLTGRPAEPKEVADLVTYVCSEQAAPITGSNFRIDSGTAETVTP